MPQWEFYNGGIPTYERGYAMAYLAYLVAPPPSSDVLQQVAKKWLMNKKTLKQIADEQKKNSTF